MGTFMFLSIAGRSNSKVKAKEYLFHALIKLKI